MRNRRRRWFLRRAALAFAVAAVAAPTAQARIIEDSGVYEGGAAALPDESKIRPGASVASSIPDESTIRPSTTQAREVSGLARRPLPDESLIRPSNVAGSSMVWPTADALRPFVGPSTTAHITDESLVRHGRIQAPVTTPVATSSDGFDWGDAGIGAGLALIVGLCGGLAAFALMSGRRETLAGA
jgi:hypothetical protein